jgi:hypothetical protein
VKTKKLSRARLEHALNNCEIHRHLDGIAEMTACAVCFAEQAAELRLERSRARQQFQMLAHIRKMADAVTGIDRARGDWRESGAVGAVKALIRHCQETNK